MTSKELSDRLKTMSDPDTWRAKGFEPEVAYLAVRLSMELSDPLYSGQARPEHEEANRLWLASVCDMFDACTSPADFEAARRKIRDGISDYASKHGIPVTKASTILTGSSETPACASDKPLMSTCAWQEWTLSTSWEHCASMVSDLKSANRGIAQKQMEEFLTANGGDPKALFDAAMAPGDLCRKYGLSSLSLPPCLGRAQAASFLVNLDSALSIVAAKFGLDPSDPAELARLGSHGELGMTLSRTVRMAQNAAAHFSFSGACSIALGQGVSVGTLAHEMFHYFDWKAARAVEEETGVKCSTFLTGAAWRSDLPGWASESASIIKRELGSNPPSLADIILTGDSKVVRFIKALSDTIDSINTFFTSSPPSVTKWRRSAIDVDAGSNDFYWSQPHEMFARAFAESLGDVPLHGSIGSEISHSKAAEAFLSSVAPALAKRDRSLSAPEPSPISTSDVFPVGGASMLDRISHKRSSSSEKPRTSPSFSI